MLALHWVCHKKAKHDNLSMFCQKHLLVLLNDVICYVANVYYIRHISNSRAIPVALFTKNFCSFEHINLAFLVTLHLQVLTDDEDSSDIILSRTASTDSESSTSQEASTSQALDPVEPRCDAVTPRHDAATPGPSSQSDITPPRRALSTQKRKKRKLYYCNCIML